MLRFLRLLFCLLLIPVSALAAGKSKGPFIGMHPEGDSQEGPRMVRPDMINGEKKFFRISPEVSGRHFGGYTAFMAQDGSFGAAFKLKEEGVRAVQILCSTYQGKLVRIIVNGRPVDVQQIDQPPTDGRIIVWSGLNRQDLLLFDKSMKRIGGVDPKQL
ncbi:MAG: hypothetical protein JWM59_1921 [Verrucomicrobiales bacterium]|nr:hypothetical protein [Verrucomicrobiales bacterium]